ncbi:MAG TPA: SDR family oxidoreductase [Clostridia bacterium]|nr:SDR family oxidoreductase [Clostridia bacterium]
MNTGLKDRLAIVAASSQGIGKATAFGLAAEGCKLALCARNEQNLAVVAEEIRSRHNVEVFTQAVDVTVPDDIAGFVGTVAQKFGRVDICITNAGGPPANTFLKFSIEDWRKAFELNLLSTIAFAREVIPHMQKNQWGRLIAITSVAVKQPIGDLILSNTVRTGVVGLVRSLANEFGKDGILVNNVGPGYTATDRLKNLAAVRSKSLGVEEAEMFRRWAADTATGKVAQPEDVADAIVFLASERAASITGQTILVDNGSYKGL